MSLIMEQYLDNLQILPADLQRKLKMLRDLDVKAQKHVESGDKLTNTFVADIAEMNRDDRRRKYDEIKSHYNKAKSFGDEKVQLAMQTYEMVDKHIRKLDTELAKFESELKRSIMKSGAAKRGGSPAESCTSAKQTASSKKARKSDVGKKRNLKNEPFEAPHVGSRKKKKTSEPSASLEPKATGLKPTALAGGGSLNLVQQLCGLGADVLDMPIDPNEPVYCLCRQVSYGQMIGCDNADCPIEWFHFNCVGLTLKPKGKWFCPKCSDERKKPKNS